MVPGFLCREYFFISGIGDFSKSGDFLKSSDFYPGDWEFFKIWGFISRGLGIFFLNLGFIPPGFLSPGIGDFGKSGIFAKSWDLYPGDWEFLGIFFPRGFLRTGTFWGWGFFFRWMGYPTKKPPRVLSVVSCDTSLPIQ